MSLDVVVAGGPREGCIEAAERLGVARFVMVSSMGAHDPEGAPEPMRPYLRAKAEADARLIESGLEWTIVRPRDVRAVRRRRPGRRGGRGAGAPAGAVTQRPSTSEPTAVPTGRRSACPAAAAASTPAA